jgi:hypothetical protein
MTNEGLSRKIQLLEDLDAAEKNVKETVEKCVAPPVSSYHWEKKYEVSIAVSLVAPSRLMFFALQDPQAKYQESHALVASMQDL